MVENWRARLSTYVFWFFNIILLFFLILSIIKKSYLAMGIDIVTFGINYFFYRVVKSMESEM